MEESDNFMSGEDEQKEFLSPPDRPTNLDLSSISCDLDESLPPSCSSLDTSLDNPTSSSTDSNNMMDLEQNTFVPIRLAGNGKRLLRPAPHNYNIHRRETREWNRRKSSREAPPDHRIERIDVDGLCLWPSLKRSNSAPMMHMVGRSRSPTPGPSTKAILSPGPPSRASSPGSAFAFRTADKTEGIAKGSSAVPAVMSRFRHTSSSQNAVNMLTPIRIPSSKRIQNIRRESNVAGCILSDVERERLVRSSAQISSSLEFFGIDEHTERRRSRAQSLTEPISILTHFLPASCSPSPTRVDNQKQCYSPSTQQIVRNNMAFSPRPSPRSTPSPTRQMMMRSLSPIALLSRGGRKRKCDELDICGSPKRPNTGSWYTTGPSPSTPRVFSPSALSDSINMKPSISSSSFDTESNDSGGSSDFPHSNSNSGVCFLFSRSSKPVEPPSSTPHNDTTSGMETSS